MDRDEVFVPYTADEVGGHPSVADEVPGPLSAVLRIAEIAKMLVFGWPAYLTMHVTGRRYSEPTNHFNPNVPLFNQKEWGVVVLSDIGLVVWVGVLGAAVYHFGLAWLVKQYLVPYLIVNMWLVMITDLQHTDPRLPHYKDGVFSWMRGALCTLDRDYGVMNVLHHHIGDTHVAHHLFSTMPHYHAQEATEALKKKLGDHYLIDDVSPGLLGIAEALWKTSEMCRFVDNEGDVLWWHRYKSEVETDKSK
jgi:omega-6 fatty acid desaturase (delta-12 desaturase)